MRQGRDKTSRPTTKSPTAGPVRASKILSILEAAYPALPFTWLDTESGDQFVFMLRREDLP